VVHRSLALARLGATAAIAGIAAWVSYWHMAGVAARYGETGASPYLLPLSVDGLIIVASICLVELAGRIRTVEAEQLAAAERRPAVVPATPLPQAAPRSAMVEAGSSGQTPARGMAKGTATVVPPPKKAAPKARRPVTETAALAAQIEADRPDVTEADVAQELGISTPRLRAVRRQARQLEQLRDLELAA
jgi:Protein of unknown function (DUF2637)